MRPRRQDPSCAPAAEIVREPSLSPHPRVLNISLSLHLYITHYKYIYIYIYIYIIDTPLVHAKCSDNIVTVALRGRRCAVLVVRQGTAATFGAQVPEPKDSSPPLKNPNPHPPAHPGGLGDLVRGHAFS